MCGNKIRKGSWTVRFRIKEHGKEKNKTLSGFDTRREAQQGYIDFMKEYEIQNSFYETENSADNMTVAELSEKYYQYNANEIKESSLMTFKARIDDFVLPFFGDKIVSDVTVKDVADWKMRINALTYKKGNKNVPYSFRYKDCIFNAFVHMMNFAMKYYGLTVNMVSREGNFSNKTELKKEMLYWTPAEFEQFYKSIDDAERNGNETITKYRLFFLTSYLAGCRKGENCALTWKDIDLDNHTIYFGKTVSRRTKDGTYKITPPKTQNSYRTTDMPEYYINMISDYKRQQMQRPGFSENDFVWSGKRVLPEQSILNVFNKFISESGVKKIRIHDLRHSCVSLLLHVAGYDLSMIYVIADRIGDTPEQILKTYGHMFPSKKKEVLNALDKMTGFRS